MTRSVMLAVAVLAAGMLMLAGGGFSGSADAAPATVEYPGGAQSSFDEGHDWTWSDVGDCGDNSCTDSWDVKVIEPKDAPGERRLQAEIPARDGNNPTYVRYFSPVEMVSPPFEYNGVGGRVPDSLTLGIDTWLDVPKGAELTIEARPVAGDPAEPVVLAKADTPKCQPVCLGLMFKQHTIAASDLKVGSEYRIVVRLWTTIPDPGGSIELDNLGLIATGDDGTDPGTDPKNSGTGSGDGNPDGANRGSGTGDDKTKPPPKMFSPSVAYLHNGKLYVRIKCPRKFRPVCRINAALTTRRQGGTAMTRKTAVRVKRGHYKRVALVIKPRFLRAIRKLSEVNLKTVTLRLKIRSKKGKRKGKRLHYLKVLARH